MQKWVDAEVREVVGVDLSPKEIDEAKRRYRQLRVPCYPLPPLTLAASLCPC